MRRNGFTLIELLGVLTLIALISGLVVISIDKSLKDSRDTLSSVQVENIKSAANMWKTDHIELVPDTGYYVLTLGDLIDAGYIDSVMDIKTGEVYNRNIVIKVGLNDIVIEE